MRTQKIKLLGTHFFAYYKFTVLWYAYKYLIFNALIIAKKRKVDLPLHCQKDKRSVKGQVDGSFQRSKRSSSRSTVSENQGLSTPDNELAPPINNKGARWRLET